MEREWNGIDFLRMSKFMSLVRHIIHAALDWLALQKRPVELVRKFSNLLRGGEAVTSATKTETTNAIDLTDTRNRGLFLHLCDLFVEELIKVCRVDGDDHLSAAWRAPPSFEC